MSRADDDESMKTNDAAKEVFIVSSEFLFLQSRL